MQPVALADGLCERIPAPQPGERARLAALDPALTRHAPLARGLEALWRIEDGRRARAPAPAWPLQVAFWNVERGRHLDGIARRLREARPDVALLCELDVGMARSELRHTASVLADALGAGYLFAVEFLELGLGNAREQARHRGSDNAESLHGAAVLAGCALERPALVRLELDGGWFGPERGERRIGGRVALLATLRVDGAPVVVASVHLESHTGPAARGRQMRALLEAIERYAPGCPALLGGDFNTVGAPRDVLAEPAALAALAAADPRRFSDPVRHEPLFDVARDFGYGWAAGNVAGATTTRALAHHPAGRPAFKLDWFFSRGLSLRDPRVVPAVDPGTGRGLSDHEMILVTAVDG